MSSIVIVKVGARTPLGLDARQTGFLLRAGFPAMAESPLADAAGEAVAMGFLPTVDPRLVGAERLLALMTPALEEAIAPVRGAAAEVHVALDEGCPDGAYAVGLLRAAVQRAMPAATVQVEARGEAAIGARLPAAMRALESRQIEAAVFGGVHSDHDPRAVAALEEGGRLFSRDNLDARMPGEAAAFVVLMREADARRFALSPLARVLGVGSGSERARPDNDAPAYEAFGLTAAVRQAAASLIETGQTAGWMLTDLTGEMRRLYEWQSVWARSQRFLGRPYIIESPAQRMGYLGAAAMPLFGAIAATAWEHGYAPSDVALAIAGADSGERAALVLGKI